MLRLRSSAVEVIKQVSLSVLLDDPDNPGAGGPLAEGRKPKLRELPGATELELEKAAWGAGSQTPQRRCLLWRLVAH